MAPLDIPRISNQCALKRKLVCERVRVGITTLRRAYRLCGHIAHGLLSRPTGASSGFSRMVPTAAGDCFMSRGESSDEVPDKFFDASRRLIRHQYFSTDPFFDPITKAWIVTTPSHCQDLISSNKAQDALAAGRDFKSTSTPKRRQRERDGVPPGAHFLPRNVLEWRLDRRPSTARSHRWAARPRPARDPHLRRGLPVEPRGRHAPGPRLPARDRHRGRLSGLARGRAPGRALGGSSRLKRLAKLATPLGWAVAQAL